MDSLKTRTTMFMRCSTSETTTILEDFSTDCLMKTKINFVNLLDSVRPWPFQTAKFTQTLKLVWSVMMAISSNWEDVFSIPRRKFTTVWDTLMLMFALNVCKECIWRPHQSVWRFKMSQSASCMTQNQTKQDAWNVKKTFISVSPMCAVREPNTLKFPSVLS